MNDVCTMYVNEINKKCGEPNTINDCSQQLFITHRNNRNKHTQVPSTA